MKPSAKLDLCDNPVFFCVLLVSHFIVLSLIPMEAGELYAFVFAKEFCELRSYGVSSADALQKAQEKAQSNSLIASSMYRDQAIILPDGNSLAARRKLNATIEMCSQLMDPL